jgi:hypothetical protein
MQRWEAREGNYVEKAFFFAFILGILEEQAHVSKKGILKKQ